MWNSTVKSLVFMSLIGLPLFSGATGMEDMSNPTEVVKKRVPVKIEGKKLLSLRVLTRPFSNIYTDKSSESPIVQSDVPALQPFYVYTRPSAEDLELESGWYEIGSNSQGKVIGWMQSKDVFEWKQTMCLVYTHPEGRKPVMMFDSKSTIKDIIKAEDEARVERVSKLYKAIDDGNISKDFVVNSIEPKRAVDIKKEFYLLPILDFEAIEFGNREARVLKLTAVTNAKAGARDESDIRKSKTYLDDAVAPSTVISKKKLKGLNVDIVWVFDTTVSMRPFIKDTLDVAKESSVKLTTNVPDNIKLKFGAWGYRDAVEDMPKIGYTTKNYTPELVDINEFTDVLSNIKVTKVDSVDFPEDMFSGVSHAMDKTAWSSTGVKFIILVGDAPSHQAGHKWNVSGFDEERLRALADDSGVYIASIHLKNPKAKKFNALAETQYRTLATNPGSGKGDSAFLEASTKDKEAFKKNVDKLTDAFIVNVKKLRDVIKEDSVGNMRKTGGELAFDDTVDTDKIMTKDNNASASKATNIANRMFRAAMVQWIGSQTEAKAPNDIVAWAIDKDLIDSDIASMDVRVLINKRQLDSLATVIQSIIQAGIDGQISGEDFFSSLQAATASIARDPNMVRQAKQMADTGLVPEFLEGLPYQSQLMAMTNELWGSWGADEQNEFIEALYTKVEAYKKIHDTSDGWIPLNKGVDEDQKVYPLSLDLLP